MNEQDDPQAFPEGVVESLRARLADPGSAPGGGSAGAVAAAMAASLVAKAARRSAGSWREAMGVVAQAESLAARCSELAEADARAFAGALRALEDRSDLERRLAESVTVLLELGETAADVAELAARTAEHCDGTYRADAVCAALLAEAATSSTAVLVAANLTVTARDERLVRARRLSAAATDALRRALESGP
jgi:formiminotetrahydrofolate cyclodeaminase